MTRKEYLELYLGVVIFVMALIAVLVAGRYASGDCLAAFAVVFLGTYLIVKFSREE